MTFEKYIAILSLLCLGGTLFLGILTFVFTFVPRIKDK